MGEMSEREREFVEICQTRVCGALENFPLREIVLADGVPFRLFELLGKSYPDFLACLISGGKAQRDFFDNMQTVRFEVLQVLPKEEFAKIPAGWLYDWSKVTGRATQTQIENLIKERK